MDSSQVLDQFTKMTQEGFNFLLLKVQLHVLEVFFLLGCNAIQPTDVLLKRLCTLPDYTALHPT
jgi:hypothetical protein